MKLSKPQIELLAELVASGKYTCSPSYPPVRKLVEMDLATPHEGRFGGHWLTPTDAGRALINQQLKQEV